MIKMVLKEFVYEFDIRESNNIVACTFLLYDRFVRSASQADEMDVLVRKLISIVEDTV
jgi:hypothetical protein